RKVVEDTVDRLREVWVSNRYRTNQNQRSFIVRPLYPHNLLQTYRLKQRQAKPFFQKKNISFRVLIQQRIRRSKNLEIPKMFRSIVFQPNLNTGNRLAIVLQRYRTKILEQGQRIRWRW